MIEHIAGLTSLESLDVGSTLMTDVGLERLTSLTNLWALIMGGNELGDAGMQALRLRHDYQLGTAETARLWTYR